MVCKNNNENKMILPARRRIMDTYYVSAHACNSLLRANAAYLSVFLFMVAPLLQNKIIVHGI